MDGCVIWFFALDKACLYRSKTSIASFFSIISIQVAPRLYRELEEKKLDGNQDALILIECVILNTVFAIR